MVNEKLVKYIRGMLKRKHPMQEIKKGLLDQGLPIKDINEAVSFVNQNPMIKKSSRFFNKNKPIDSSPKQPPTKTPNIAPKTSPKTKTNSAMQKYKKDRLKYNTKIFLGVVFVIIFVVIFLLILLNSSNPKSNLSISEFNLNEGAYFNLSKKSKVSFGLDRQEYVMIANSIKEDSICFQINTGEKCFVKGKVETVDLNGDNKKDLIVRLDKVEDKLGFLFFKKYGSSVCSENWNCTDFGICINGVKRRLCVDSNSCGTVLNKPVIQEFCLESSNRTYYYDIPSDLDLEDCGIEEETFVNQCFLDATSNCEPAKIIGSSSIELNPILAAFGVNLSSNFSSQMEVRGFSEDGNCTFYEKALEYSSAFHPDYFNALLESGDYTLEEIMVMEEEINFSMQDTIGAWTECSYNHDGLIAMVNSYYSLGPMGEIDCDYHIEGMLSENPITFITCNYGGIELNGVCTSGMAS